MKDQTYITVRTASPWDAEQILAVYAPYVEHTAITFEYEVPDLEEFQKRIGTTLQRYPYLVSERGKEIVGFAYLSPFKGRAAYDWSAEVSIYVKDSMRKCGIGRRLYEEIERIAREQHLLNLNACIGYPEKEDEYLTKNSVQFHAHMGYQMVGEFHKSGYKFGRWYDMVWMEKMIGEHKGNPEPFLPFSELS
ncbi:GNAT family N-acetyltransferase [Sellimonas intestinalis]|uniref:GNAT family N-acetyltransferase n=1 Tax=Sellimonas intestinalis TaxID=1653434 RepID=UPI0022E7AF11|nr:GNAT family N-acetyltransferase [Sellimonas intestinalis]